MKQEENVNFLTKIAGIFERLELPYLVTGGMAVSVWGRPRSTADVDVVIELESAGISGLLEALKELSEAGYIDEDVVREAVRGGGEFNFIDGATGMKIDFWVLGKGAFDASQLKRRVGKNVFGQKIYFLSPEDLILSKLIWYRKSRSTRHLEDIESILKISGSELDMKYLKEWSSTLEVSEELGKLLS